jgi:hypothetical protein
MGSWRLHDGRARMTETCNFTGIRFWRLELIVTRRLILSGESSAALEWIEGFLAERPAAGSYLALFTEFEDRAGSNVAGGHARLP